jgi:2',3'-cyclic-nucleotide 2'-phosphodiesterase / 3'-nucleotidase / 5'-nucleotidase
MTHRGSNLFVAAGLATLGLMTNAKADLTFDSIVYEGESPTIRLEVVGSYRGDLYNGSSSTEPAAYDPLTRRLFGIKQLGPDFSPRGVVVLDISDPSTPIEEFFIDVTDIAPSGPFLASFVAVKNGVLAVAVENVDEAARGMVAFYSTSDFRLLADPVEVGVQPSGAVFTHDGGRLVVVSTGEATDDVDPPASVSVIDIGRGGHRLVTSVRTDDLSSFNDRGEELVESGVRIFASSASVAQDLELDSIALSPNSRFAYATLLPNNAFAVIDIRNAKVIDILPFGSKDYSERGNKIDASDEDDAIDIRNWPINAMYQPDLLAAYRTFGRTFLVTPNEGAERGDDQRVGDLTLDENVFPDHEVLKEEKNLGRLSVTTAQLEGQIGNENQADPDGDGLVNELFAFGARSFSIWTTHGRLIFDSGDDFEQITAAAIPDFFNTEDNNNQFDSRSDARGPEPEALAVGRIGLRHYVFVTLEQIGGVMVYDITDPDNPSFQVYINNRNFLTDPPLSSDDDVCPEDTLFSDLPSPVCAEAGDLGPEGIMFIPRSKSPIDAPLVVVTQEISDTTTLYRIDRVEPGRE